MSTTATDRQPPAITQPGEMWHLNDFLSHVIILRDGPDRAGSIECDGRHQLIVARFVTVRDAAAAVQAFNAWAEVCAAWEVMDKSALPKDDAEMRFFSDVINVLRKHGRT